MRVIDGEIVDGYELTDGETHIFSGTDSVVDCSKTI